MAKHVHPLTGVPQNIKTHKRKPLDQDAAITAHILRLKGRLNPFYKP